MIRILWSDRRGATLVEFALILPALCVVLLAIFELGYRSYAASVVQGALHDAARMATVGGVSQAQIDAQVRQRLNTFARTSTVTISSTSYYEFTGVRRAETVTGDTAPLGAYNRGDCFEDANGNNRYDLDRGRTGMGGADDIVRYEVTMTYRRILPVARFLGWSDMETIQANTVLRNQPFSGRVINVQRLREIESPAGSNNWVVGPCT